MPPNIDKGARKLNNELLNISETGEPMTWRIEVWLSSLDLAIKTPQKTNFILTRLRVPMHKSPELWSMLIAWIAEHRSEGSYAFIAGLMAILRGIYNGDSPWWRRILDAGMCALVAFFIKDLLMLMSFEQQWAYIGSVFIGFLGIDYFSSVLRRVVGSKTGIPPQQ